MPRVVKATPVEIKRDTVVITHRIQVYALAKGIGELRACIYMLHSERKHQYAYENQQVA